MKICIILTCEYPYITAEPFLETEIRYLSKTFDKVMLFPINASSKNKQTRLLPDNVSAFPIGCINSKFRYPAYIIKGIFSRINELPINKLEFKQKLVALYEKGRSDFVFHKILNILNNANLDGDKITIYSYWFTDQSIVAWKLKEFLSRKCSIIKAVSRAHGYDVYWERNKCNFIPYQDICLQKLDKVYVCSENGKKYLSKKYKNLEAKLDIARLGTVDYGVNFTDKKNILLTCCSLKKVKRISLFAEALGILHKTYDKFKWICIGDGEELEKIKEIIFKYGFENNVEMLGRMSNEDVLAFYAENEISYFCNMSISEGVPVSIMEAMSFGIPVIATDVGGNSELVSDKCGKLLNPHLTAKQVANVLLEQIKLNTKEYTEKRFNARSLWESKSSAEYNYNIWCQNISVD